MKRSREYYEGVRAAEVDGDNGPCQDCPYGKGTTEWMEWTSGHTRRLDLEQLDDVDTDKPSLDVLHQTFDDMLAENEEEEDG